MAFQKAKKLNYETQHRAFKINNELQR